MLKGILLIVVGLFLFNPVLCKSIDTSVYYYMNDFGGGFHKVNSIDSADFFRVILPPDSGEELYNVKEFYKNGKPKFVGKTDASMVRYNDGRILLHGNCISFFPNGKKQSIINYYHGYKDGIGFQYYPNGKLFCRIKYFLTYLEKNEIYLDCYDLNGVNTAKDGNGHWMEYDRDFKNILLEGTVKDGRFDGEWKGGTMDDDSIKFVYVYKKGDFVSARSWDKKGNAYAFTHAADRADYRGGASSFSSFMQRHLIVPRDSVTGKKIRDSIKVSFVIETDGHLTHFEVVGHPNPALAEAAINVLKLCPPWKPRKYYGIPVRSKIIFPLNIDTYPYFTYMEQVLDIKFPPRQK